MPVARTRSVALLGLTGSVVEVEADLSSQLPGFLIIGLPDAALASDGTTIAFLAGGIDRFYPLGHESLLTRIAQTGAVVSELPCGAAPTKWRFLQRNRLIAAASQATVVLEAGIRSGSLNTAGHAAAMRRFRCRNLHFVGAAPHGSSETTAPVCAMRVRSDSWPSG